MNINKRGNTLEKRFDFMTWLNIISPQIICLQEVCRSDVFMTNDFLTYKWVAGSHNSAIYLHDEIAYQNARATKNFSLLYLENKSLIVSLYLSAYKSSERIRQLRFLSEQLDEFSATEDIENIIIMGDFNLAPREEDGLVNGNVSKFTSKKERNVFAAFLQQFDLRDLGINEGFTIEKKNKRYHTQFRVDLALVHTKKESDAYWDHSVRQEHLFTDHSAIILDVRG